MNNDFKAFLQSGDWVDYLNAHDTISVVNGQLFSYWLLLHDLDDCIGDHSYFRLCSPLFDAWQHFLDVLDSMTFSNALGDLSDLKGGAVTFVLGDLKE